MTHREAELTAQLIRSLVGPMTSLSIRHGFFGDLTTPISVLHMGRFIAEGSYQTKFGAIRRSWLSTSDARKRRRMLKLLERVGAAYGESQILSGVDLTVGVGRSSDAAWEKRRRQDNAAALHHRSASQQSRTRILRRRRRDGDAAASPRTNRNRLRSTRAWDLSAPDG